MLMAVRHSLWSVFFCSVILPTSKVMFRYLALYFRLSLLYPHVWFSSVIFGSTHIPWFCSFTLVDIAYPIPFLYPHWCSVPPFLPTCMVLFCHVPSVKTQCHLLYQHFIPFRHFARSYDFVSSCLCSLLCLRFCYTDVWWLCQIHN